MNRNKQYKNNKGKGKDNKRRTNNHDEYRDNNGKSTNDVAWYNTNPDIASAAATLNFSRPLGVPLNRDFVSNNMAFAGTTVHTAGYTNDVPGIMSIDLMPAIGHTDKSTDALNMASTAIYSFVRHANSGHSNYDAPDLMLYIMANTQVYAFINYIIRMYRTLTLYSGHNRYLPKVLTYAQGGNYDNLIHNLANFRYQIDALILKAQSLAVPASMSIFARHAFLYSNIYAEGTSPKDQLYLYNPAGFWKFDLDEQGAGCLKFTKFSGQALTVEELMTYGNDMIDRLIGDEDMSIMSGDILKAYGVDGILKLNTISDLQPLVPIYDPVVLTQFKNAKIFNMSTNRYTHGEWIDSSIYQSEDKSYLVSTPSYHTKKHDANDATYADAVVEIFSHSAAPLISATSPNPGVDEILEITRLTNCFGPSYTNEEGIETWYPIFCASEIPVGCVIWITDDTGKSFDYARVNTGINVGDEFTPARTATFGYLSNFKYAPEVMLINPKDASGSIDYYGSIYDMDNYTIEDANTIDRIHDAVLLNMLSVPSIAAFSTVRRGV